MMTESADYVAASEYRSRLRALLGPGGIRAGFPRKRRDRWILLQAIARQFEPDEVLGEIEATQRIGGFLLAGGTRWEMDRVNLRRALVDEGFLDRDPNGRDYRRSRRHESRVRFEPVAAEIDEILDNV